MPNCASCEYKWSCRYTLNKAFSFKDGIKCPNCGMEQFITPESRKRGSVISLITLPVLILPSLFVDVNSVTSFSIAGGLFILVLILIPFSIELSNGNETLW